MRRRYIQVDGQLVEVPLNYTPEPRSEYHIMGDIKPYRSMLDGREISSRSTHREHLRSHGCIEVGNETKYMMSKVRPLEAPPGLKQTIAALANEKLRR